MDSDGTGIHQFELADARGRSHTYVVAEHPAGEGMAIMFALLGLGAPTVVQLVSAALASDDLIGAIVSALGKDAPDLGTSDLGRMLREVDFRAVAPELGRALAADSIPGLARRIVSRTHRDGQPLSGGAFELAYQANYGELLQAVWRICSINRFFPLPSTSESAPALARGR